MKIGTDTYFPIFFALAFGIVGRARAATTSLNPALGGETSIVSGGADAFSEPARNASRKHRRSFVIGNALFKQNWVTIPSSVKGMQGLGPMFNAQSCSTCHFKDGRGRPPEAAGESFSSMLIRLSIPGENDVGGPKEVPYYGDQLRHRAIVKVRPAGDVKVSYEDQIGSYPDGTPFHLQNPIYKFEKLSYGDMPKDLMISPRVAPQIIGLGLLEAINEKDILANADPEDRNKDGISGKANWVWDVAAKKKRLGRFGWKANQPSLVQQDAGAFAGDMGITSERFPKKYCAAMAEDCLSAPALNHVEINETDLEHVATYTRILAVPMQRHPEDPQIQRGHQGFVNSQCSSCHIETFRTGEAKGFPELSHQQIHPFTDLLVHDMGEALADHRPDFLANGNEWRTPPLWGVGLFQDVNGHTRYLHDGRARNLEEAILWHGGEAQKSKELFMALPKEERSDIIHFLESL